MTSCFADKKSRHCGAENEAIFRRAACEKAEAIARVEAVARAGALQGLRAEGALHGERATWSGGHRELQLVDDYRRNSDLAPQVARQSHAILSLLRRIESEQPCEDVGLVAVEAKRDVAA